jgi:hypothetical protein
MGRGKYSRFVIQGSKRIPIIGRISNRQIWIWSCNAPEIEDGKASIYDSGGIKKLPRRFSSTRQLLQERIDLRNAKAQLDVAGRTESEVTYPVAGDRGGHVHNRLGVSSDDT